MSPEQASGQSADARSDIFSFGVLLYELLAGRKPFAGKTGLEILQTIIHSAAPPLPDEIRVRDIEMANQMPFFFVALI
jgi:serine/threonine-protein kinase